MNLAPEQIFVPSSEEQLIAWLQQAQIDITHWGQAGAKSVAQLWHEVQAGETVLQRIPPRRHVNVVRLLIWRGEQQLIEVRQILADGAVRERGRPPTEKIMAGETASAAAHRGLAEELGLLPTQISKPHVVPATSCQQEPSPSYPGLPSCYWIHDFICEVGGLPAGPFTTREKVSSTEGSWLQHEWAWVSKSGGTHVI